jgi:hypothetical protein
VILGIPSRTSSRENNQPSRLPEATPNEWATTTELQYVALTKGTDFIRGSATNLFHHIHAAEGAEEVDATKNDLGDERIRYTNGLENSSTVVKEVVGCIVTSVQN